MLGTGVVSAFAACRNAVSREEVKERFEERARREFVGQQQAWNFVRDVLESYSGIAPRSTCRDWVLHFSGPSGSGKSFLAEIVASAAFDTWVEEPYPRAEYGLASTACATLAAGGGFFGPFGWAGAGVGCAAGLAFSSLAKEAVHQYFRAPEPYPRQCGVRLHKFARGAQLAEVEEWEFRVAAELQRDPGAVIVVDDVGRLSDAAAFEHFGRLLCGGGGHAIPEFRTGRSGDDAEAERVAASEALFVLTSDLELEPSEPQLSCEVRSFETMLEAVSRQSRSFWDERKLRTPDWWGQLPLVPFRELCADELSQAVAKYLLRECDAAVGRVRAHLHRKRARAATSSLEYRWTGSVRHGPEALGALDAHVAEAVASSRLVGGRQGAWLLANFHQTTMRPAMQTLTVGNPAEGGRELLAADPRWVRREVSLLNSTTITYTAEICVEIAPDAGGGTPLVRFVRMEHMCR